MDTKQLVEQHTDQVKKLAKEYEDLCADHKNDSSTISVLTLSYLESLQSMHRELSQDLKKE